MPRRKKIFTIWAEDDWLYLSENTLITHLVEMSLRVIGAFHYKKENCYKGKPRKVKVTFEEI